MAKVDLIRTTRRPVKTTANRAPHRPAGARPASFERLEGRRLMAAALTLAGGTENDAFYLRMVDATDLGVWVDAAEPGQGAPTQTVATSTFTSIAASGTGTDASLTLDLSGGLVAPGGVTWDGGPSAGPLDVTKVSAAVTVDGDAVTAGSVTATATNAGQLVVDAGANPVAFTVTATPTEGSVRLDGYGADTLAVTGGRLTLAAGSTAAPTLTVDDRGALTVAGTGSNASIGAVSFAGLTVEAAATVVVTAATPHAGSLLSVGALSVAATGGLNLNGADLVVHDGDVARVAALVQAGQTGGSVGDGTVGLGSAIVAADPTRTTTLAVALDATAAGTATPLLASVDGQAVAATDVLVTPALFGDANLDGVVDGADYARIDAAYASQSTASPVTGWTNGDFNNDGVIDGSDYTLIDNAFNARPPAAPTPAGTISSPADIPGLVAWYKASPATVSTDANGFVTEWADQSGNGNNVYPVAGDDAPVLSPDGTSVAFPSYVVGGGHGPELQTATPLTVTPASMSVFAVVQQENVGGNFFVAAGSAVAMNPGLALYYSSPSGSWIFGDGQTYGLGTPAASGSQRVVIGGTASPTGTTAYLNGQSLTSTAVLETSPVTAPLLLGSADFPPNARESEVCLYDRPLTPTEAAELNAYLATADAVNVAPTVNTVIDGDSMTFGNQPANTPLTNWADQTPALTGQAYWNFGMPGRHLAVFNPATGQASGSILNSFAAFNPNATTNLYVVFAGGNDIFTGSQDATTTFDQLLALCDGAKAYGAAHGFAVRTVVVTTLHRGTASGQTYYNGTADQYDAMIRGDTSGAFDAVADIASLPQLSDPNNLTYFFPDATHPNVAAEPIIADAVNAAIAAATRGT